MGFATSTYASTCHRCQQETDSWWSYCPRCGVCLSTAAVGMNYVVTYGSAQAKKDHFNDTIRRDRERLYYKQKARQRRFEERGFRGLHGKPGRKARWKNHEDPKPEWWKDWLRQLRLEAWIPTFSPVLDSGVESSKPPVEAGLEGHPVRAPTKIQKRILTNEWAWLTYFT